MRGGQVTLEIFKVTFLDWFFPREMKAENVKEFINLCKGGKRVHDYSLEFIKFSKYAPSIILDPRDQMR